ncbi:MAG: phosphatase PAP2 family protein [Bacteroidetes bacterium]|nr:MAG: phosphatase PAP2 family protein [Bacteroidota bacterium]
MVTHIIELDKELFLLLNGWHTPFFDWVFEYVSFKYTWIPLYLWWLYEIVQKEKKQFYFPLIWIILVITLSDQISVHLFKNVFQRLRPCHNPDIQHLVHIVNNHCGGKYGFVSSHAANTFALVTVVSNLLYRQKRKIKVLLFVWATIVAYSRVYLGVHYPLDIIAGAILGWTIGQGMWKFYQFILPRLRKFPRSRF